MAGYLSFPYAAPDPDALLAQALQRIAELFPGWTPRETHLEYAVLAETVRAEVDTRLLLSDVSDEVFRTYGTRLLRLPAGQAAAAVGEVVFDLTGPAGPGGLTVPAGTQVLWRDAGGVGYLLELREPVSVPAGQSSSSPAPVVAVVPGAAGNGLPAGPVQLVDAVAGVQAVRAVTPTAGGQDAETTDAYMDRLAEFLGSVRIVPYSERDFAVLAKSVSGVGRALAVAGYNPTTGQTDAVRTVTVFPITAQGRDVPAPVAQQVLARLDAEREVNFRVHVATPTRTPVAVEVTVRPLPDADPVQLAADVRAAVAGHIDPAVHGGGDQRPPTWVETNVVRYLKLSAVVDRVPGVQHVEGLRLNRGTADVVLAGPAALPAPLDDDDAPSTVTVTVL